MQTNAPSRRTIFLLLAFTVTSVLLTFLAYRTLGGSLPLGAERYSVSVPLRNAGSLVSGSDVAVAGVKIGEVRAVRRQGNGAVARLDIDAEYVPIRSQARAILRTKTLLGEAYVEIGLGPRSAPSIPEGGSLAASRVRPTVTLDEFLGTFSAETRNDTRKLFGGLARAVDGRGTALNQSLGRAAPVSANLESIFTTLSAETTDLQQLFADSGTVLDALGRRESQLRGAITAGNDVFGATAQRDRQLAASVRALPPFIRQLRRTSQVLAGGSGDLDRAVEALAPSAPLVAPTLSSVNTSVPEFKALFEALPRTIMAGKEGLPALRAILEAVPEALGPLYRTTRQLIPVVQLASTYRRVALAAIANAAALPNGTVVGPGGKIIHRVSTSIAVSNETVGGWVKRLPTNRANPFPTPDGLEELSKMGFLKSYDCRNLGNTLYLPAIGTGVPPCVTQGPWTYRGASRYYPQLRAAPR